VPVSQTMAATAVRDSGLRRLSSRASLVVAVVLAHTYPLTGLSYLF
jgi:hypothetical protein